MTDERVNPGHPCVRRWVREHPGVSFDQTPGDLAVRRLLADLGLGAVERDLGGEDNLTLLVNRGRHVLRSYKPFVSRDRIRDLQLVRAAVGAAGLVTPVPITVKGETIHRCGDRWAEVEPYTQLPTDVRQAHLSSLFAGLGQLHKVLARLSPVDSSDLRQSFVTVRVLREWTRRNTVDEVISPDHASHLRALLDAIEERWIQPDPLPTHIIHTDPHAGNIIQVDDEARAFTYLDFAGIEMAPRVHDLAVALVYQLAPSNAASDLAVRELPESLEAYNQASQHHLTANELAALPVYAATVAVYYDICGWAPPGWQSTGSRLLNLAIDALR